MVLESEFQAELIKELRVMFPGCVILKNDPNYLQGFPDLLILFRTHWAALEVKRSDKEPFRPNQEYYLEELDKISFAACIYPENREKILDELQFSFRAGRQTRLPKRVQIPLD